MKFDFLDPEQVCEQVLAAVHHSGPPTDLYSVCSLWPDLRVHEEDLDKEGYLIPLGVHGAEILIRRNDSPARKKFTLAHELGHWTQAHLNSGQVALDRSDRPLTSFRTHHRPQTPEEVWCNKFAACLLMPKKDLERYLFSEDFNLAERIARGHSVFQVSNEAFLVRVTDVTPVSVFEVVSTHNSSRIRRKFLSRHRPDNQVEQTMDRLLDAFRGADSAPGQLGVIGRYKIEVKLLRGSLSSCSWLASAVPVTGTESLR